jgi:hypothetical protein
MHFGLQRQCFSLMPFAPFMATCCATYSRCPRSALCSGVALLRRVSPDRFFGITCRRDGARYEVRVDEAHESVLAESLPRLQLQLPAPGSARAPAG